MPNKIVVNGDALIAVRLMVTDDANAPLSNTTAVDMKVSDVLAGAKPAATVGSVGAVTRQAAQADSVAADVATLRADFNALLAKLRLAGVLA